MTQIEGIMLLGYAVGALFALGHPRALLWLLAGAVTAFGSSLYWRSGSPHPELVAGAMDAAVCFAIYFAGRFRWEMWVWRLFQVMLLVNIIRMAGVLGFGPPVDHEAYAITLEAANWLVILTIGGTAALQRIGYDHVGAGDPWGSIRGAVRALHAQRRHPPFTAR